VNSVPLPTEEGDEWSHTYPIMHRADVHVTAFLVIRRIQITTPCGAIICRECLRLQLIGRVVLHRRHRRKITETTI
jgi:hypothetical protein